MRCLNTIKVNGRFFNCGRCHACRINKTSEWTLRLLYELSDWKSASFVTLTYSNEHLPKDMSLKPDELKKFWYKLRSYSRRKFKYFACG